MSFFTNRAFDVKNLREPIVLQLSSPINHKTMLWRL